MMECGQPLHAFDFAKLRGPEIIVREARPGEQFEAIDHRTYALRAGHVRHRRRPASRWPFGGVMGGAETEVSAATTDLLIEAAEFAPLSIRTTARKLNLHSPSSYRFERGVDPDGVDWASRRCCELILELAGGELAEGVIDVGRRPLPRRPPIVLRLSQLKRILGIEIPRKRCAGSSPALGAAETQRRQERPSWSPRPAGGGPDPRDRSGRGSRPHPRLRRDPRRRRRADGRFPPQRRGSRAGQGPRRAHGGRLRRGDDRQRRAAGRGRTRSAPGPTPRRFAATRPMLRGADRLRRSLIPSLLEARRMNEALANPVIELFEIARVYLPAAGGPAQCEQLTLGIVSGGDYYLLKGVVEDAGRRRQVPRDGWRPPDTSQPLLDGGTVERVAVGRPTSRLSWAKSSPRASNSSGCATSATVAELRLEPLEGAARLVPQHVEQSPFPAIARDLNIVVDERVRWSDLAETVRRSGGELLENVEYQEIYRDPESDGPGKKRLLFSIALRSPNRTLTSRRGGRTPPDDMVDAIRALTAGRLLGGDRPDGRDSPVSG